MSTLEVKVGSRVLGEIEVTTDYDNYNDWLNSLTSGNVDEILSTSRLSVPIHGPLNRFTITEVTSTQYVLKFNEVIYGGKFDSIYKALGKANGTFARRGGWLLSAVIAKNGFDAPEEWTPSDLPNGVTLWLNFNDAAGSLNGDAGVLYPTGTFKDTAFTNDGNGGPTLDEKTSSIFGPSASTKNNRILNFEDEGQDFYSSELSTPNFSTITDRFIQVLAKPEGQTGNDTVYALGGTTNRIYFSGLSSGSRNVYSNLKSGNVSLGSVSGNSWTLVAHSYEYEGDPDSGGGQLKGFLNTVLADTTNDEDAETLGATDELTLGDTASIADNSVQSFAGLMADFILLSYIPTELERKKLEGWHCHKFGLTSLLSARHLYKEFRPNK